MTCCDRPNVTTMDYTIESVTFTHRECMRCHRHWHGVEGDVKEYTGAEFRAWAEAEWARVLGVAA